MELIFSWEESDKKCKEGKEGRRGKKNEKKRKKGGGRENMEKKGK